MFLIHATSNYSKQLFSVLILLIVLVYTTNPAFANKVVDEAKYESPSPFAFVIDPVAPFVENAPGQIGNPFPLDLPETFSTPTFGDLDGDGDLDMLSGDGDGNVLYFLNVGSADVPAFVLQTGGSDPFADVDAPFGKSGPGLMDFNGDDLLDLFVGDEEGAFTYWENTGSAGSPAFTQGTVPTGMDVDIGNRSQPVFVDLDGDGDEDMVSGEFNGTLFYFMNNGDGSFSQLSGGASPFVGVALGAGGLTKPALGDLDFDGDYDLLVGNAEGTILYFENTGDMNTPAFTPVTGEDNPFEEFDAGGESAPALADVTAGNGLDVITGNTDGNYYYHLNQDPLPVELTSFGALLNGEDVVLSWETASETNNAGFEVQQYIAGSFQAVGWVDGAGTTADARSYSYSVNKVAHGSHRFRLKQVDFDGTFAFSAVSEVARPLEGRFEMEDIYPNPFNPQATFHLTIASDQDVTVAVYDMQGRMMGLLHSGALSSQQAHQFTIDGSQWASGNYIVRAVGETFNSSQLVTLLK